MKKSLIIVLLAIMAKGVMAAPSFEITPGSAIFFGGSVDLGAGELDLGNTADFNINAGVNLLAGTLEFAYTYARPTATVRIYSPATTIPGLTNYDPRKININYIQLNYLKTYLNNPKVAPFFLMGIGATKFRVKGATEDVWNASMALGAGLKYFVNDKYGIRLQGRLLMPFYMQGVGIGVGTGGAGVTTVNSVSILQGDISLGIILRIGNKGGFGSSGGRGGKKPNGDVKMMTE